MEKDFEQFGQIFNYCVSEDLLFRKQAEECGYTPISTFFSDLSVAECYGAFAINDTFNNIVKSWLGDYKMFTEFVLALNWKSWEWSERNVEIGQLYSDLYYKADELYFEKYQNDSEKAQYYYQVTD